MKHLFSCLKRYGAVSVLAPLFKLLEAMMELTVPLVVAEIVNVGIANGDKTFILHACLLLVGFGAAGFAFALTAQYFAAKAAVGCASEMRLRLFTKLQSLSFEEIDGVGVSAMLTRMTSDVQQVQNGVNLVLRILLRSPIVVFGATAMAFVVDAKAALVFVAVIPLLAAVIVAVMAACIPKYRAVQEDLDGVYLSVRENLTGARVLRAFRKEKDEGITFRKKSGVLAGAQERVGAIAALTAPLTFVLVELAVIALIYTGALRVRLGAIEQGDVLALYSYLSLILVELIKLTNLIINVAKTVSCAKRVGAVLDMPPEPDVLLPRGEKKGENAIDFEGVSFTYKDGGAPAISDLSFSVPAGATLGILGGTGSGKSTLVRLLPRFYTATGGVVRVFGEDVRTVPVKELRARIGVVPQKTVLFHGTIASNLRWGNENATDEELLEAAAAAQALDVVEAKGGLGGEVAQEGRNLSGGQRQRLAIARALVKKPDILILDDSASALDYATDARLRAALKELPCTVIIVSQRIASVQGADEIVVLDDGHIAAKGTHEELLSVPLYREILRSQTEEEA